MLTKKESRIEKNIKHTQATQKIYVVHLRPQSECSFTKIWMEELEVSYT